MSKQKKVPAETGAKGKFLNRREKSKRKRGKRAATLVPELPPQTPAEILEEEWQSLKENRDAMRPLSALRHAGLKDERLLVWLLRNIWIASQPPAVDSLESVPGLTFDVINNMPVNALELAQHMTTLQEHGLYLFGPLRVRDERKLAADLREMAERLSAKTNEVRRRKRPGTKGMERGSMEKLRLIWFIRHITGQPHYDDVAKLINTFNRMEDQRYRRRTSGEVTVNSLTLLWKDYGQLPELANTPTELPLSRQLPRISPIK